MIHIKNIESADKQTVEAVVQIHLDTFQGFFLTFMGRGFLRQLYRSYCEHEPSGLLGAFLRKPKVFMRLVRAFFEAR